MKETLLLNIKFFTVDFEQVFCIETYSCINNSVRFFRKVFGLIAFLYPVSLKNLSITKYSIKLDTFHNELLDATSGIANAKKLNKKN